MRSAPLCGASIQAFRRTSPIRTSMPLRSFRAWFRMATSKWSRPFRRCTGTSTTGPSARPRWVRFARGRTSSQRATCVRCWTARTPRRSRLHARVSVRRDGGIQTSLRRRSSGRRNRHGFCGARILDSRNDRRVCGRNRAVRDVMIARGIAPERVAASGIPVRARIRAGERVARVAARAARSAARP